MAFKLSGVMLNRVDLCPQGANPDANIVLFKSKGGHVPKKAVAKKAVKKTAKSDTRSKSRQRGEEEEDEEEEDVAKTKRRAKAKDDDDLEDEDLEDDDDLEEDEDLEKSDDDEEEDDDDLEEEDEEEDESVVKGKKGKKVIAKRQSTDDESANDDDSDEEDEEEPEALDETVLKSLPAKARAFIRKQHETLVNQTRELKKTARDAKRTAKEALETANIEKARRETMEAVEKAKTLIPNLPGTDEEKGAVMKSIATLPKDVAKTLRKMLKSGNNALKSLLMTETGSRRGRSDEEDDAVSELRAKADEIKKADTKLTKEQAFEKACLQNPDLFSQYKEEKRRRRAN